MPRSRSCRRSHKPPLLAERSSGDDKRDLHPKLLLRVGDLLKLPAIAAINRDLGFGKSARNPALGRWPKTVERWLRHRESNPAMLQSLVRAGFRATVMSLAKRVGYKPDSERFFEILRWKQKQSGDGRRSANNIAGLLDALRIGCDLRAPRGTNGHTLEEVP